MTTSTPGQSRVLQVAELFGPTFQGEGPSCGQRALFVRLSGCNLDCGWCDTPYTWDWERFSRDKQTVDMPLAAIASWAAGLDTDLIVITGGEPMIQHRRLRELAAELVAGGHRVELETNGTIAPDAALLEVISVFNVSPKLNGSGIPEQRRLRRQALAAFRDCGKAEFKFVITGPADIEELIQLQTELSLQRVWVMPEGTTEASVLAGLRELAEPALTHGWNLTSRLHVLLWGDERGR